MDDYVSGLYGSRSAFLGFFLEHGGDLTGKCESLFDNLRGYVCGY